MSGIFRASVLHWKGAGCYTHKITRVQGISPERQRELMAEAVMGYDIHHPDAPGDGLKFSAPLTKKKEEPKSAVLYQGSWLEMD